MTARPRDMVFVAGGEFTMGSDRFYPDERPAHRRSVAPFLIDRSPVTNDQFAAFVAATGYLTVAERDLDPSEFPGADHDTLVPGSMVFTPTNGPVDLRDWRQWWRWQPGANWRHPHGPDSSIDDRLTHPVVHVAYADALAYAHWAHARLPTEAEHEFASASGQSGTAFAWGDEPYPDGKPRANTWLGRFPYDSHGAGGTTPVGHYPANTLGLVDMIGNVWEWTADYYRPGHFPAAARVEAEGRPDLLTPRPPSIPNRVLKGGSHLCSPDYCLRFRPAARSPQTEDTSMSHIGFRCARSI